MSFVFRSLRPLVVAVLALWKGLSQKEIGARAGFSQKQVSKYLRGDDLEDTAYQRLLAALRGRPVEVDIVTGPLEALQALRQESDLSLEEREAVERGVLEGSRALRATLTEAVRRSRARPPLDRYPEPGEREPARWQAGVLWEILRELPEAQQLAVVTRGRAYRSWALMERVGQESVNAASQDLERAAALARLAVAIAEQVRGPEGWCNRVRGYAAAHGANVLRVVGDLKAADAAFEPARRLWHAGSDPDGVLDPGRLLDLEASLRRAQRRFEEALSLLDQARRVSHSPGRILINKGFTLEVMGQYEEAIETLLEAEPLVDRNDVRPFYMLRFNLAVNYCHVRRFGEATQFLEEVRGLALGRGDKHEVLRVTWLEGRIAAGLGRPEDARALLGQARRGFDAREMWYDVALALLEEAVLLLDLGFGRRAEVKPLAQELVRIFDANGVHREALATLQLFREAVERDEVTVELSRRVLRFLYRARYDQGLRFTNS